MNSAGPAFQGSRMRRSKYNAKPTLVDGIRFHSRKESQWYLSLKDTERKGRIRDLVLQPSFPCVVNGQKVCVYKADFAFIDRDGNQVVHDVKGVKKGAAWAHYRTKKKLVEALYPGIRIIEI